MSFLFLTSRDCKSVPLRAIQAGVFLAQFEVKHVNKRGMHVKIHENSTFNNPQP